jgi:hypothetical protein
VQNILTVVKRFNTNHSIIDIERVVEAFNKLKWAAYRVVFYAWIGLSTLTVVSGYLIPCLSSYYFFGTWRFWKVWSPGWRLSIQAYRILYLTLRGRFRISVPLMSPPVSDPDRSIVRISENWEHGESCGYCGVCCDLIKCPIMDKEKRLCLGYNSFFWRYFNCGRFPSNQSEIDRYHCPKWVMKSR